MKKAQINIEPSFFNPPKFLIVEDNQFARNQLINLITELNSEYQIIIAEDDNIAMTKLNSVYEKKKLYDIVFMDINLPYKNRIEIAKSIRNSQKTYAPDLQTKIIGISINSYDKKAQSNLFDQYSKL